MKLFTKTCRKDFEWLRIAIHSVLKHCDEKIDWYIVCDRLERPEVNDICVKAFEHWKCGTELRWQIAEIQEHWLDAAPLGDGYIQQQWVKMNAHRFVGNDYFLNWDSDVIALRPFSPKSFMSKWNKPIMWFTPFNHLILGDPPIHTARRAFLRNIFGGSEISFEWMRCMPIWMNGEILRVAEGRKNEWERTRILLMAKPVHGMSEFNIIGEFSHRFFPDAYDWRNTLNSEPTWAGPIDSPTAITCQGWSWGDIPESFKALVPK